MQKYTKEERTRTTSWTTDQLLALTQKKNHKVEYDGFEFWWYCRPDKKWVLQSIKGKENHNDVYHLIFYNIALWKQEYKKRVKDEDRRAYYKMQKNIQLLNEISKINKDDTLSIKEKVIKIWDINPTYKIKEVAKILNISDSNVRYHKPK